MMTVRLFAAASLLMSVVAMSLAAAADEPVELRAKRNWIAEVEQGDYFFWERFFFRRDNPREFPLPTDWYRPAEIVEGEPGVPLTVRDVKRRRLSASAIARIEAYLQPRETGAFFVMHQGAIDYQSFAPGMHAGSLLAVRSLAKVPVALLVAIAIEDKKIGGLDEPVGKYLSEWKGDARGRITLRQLLDMSSGLEQVPLRFEPDNKGLRLAEGSDVHATALSFTRVREPDLVWGVNNADTQLLAMVVERATGKRYAEYLSEKIWRPMGLDAATLNLDGKRGNARAYCCMRARGPDWLKIGSMLMHDGMWNGRRILPQGWTQSMLVPTQANPYSGKHILLGWGPDQPRPSFPFPPYREPFAVPGVFFISGGMSISLWMVPSLDLVILRWGNDPPDWDPTLVANIVIRDLQGGRRP